MRCLVTGCAGFVGSNLTDRLLAAGHQVIGYDNFSTGQRRFLEPALQSARFELVPADLLDEARLVQAMGGADIVFHLAANADVRHGPLHPRLDIEQNTLGTHNVLEAMRQAGVPRLVFASSGSVYGEPEVFPTPESCPFPVQTSLYGASKAAAEGLISAYCQAFGLRATIFRFVSLLGRRYTHGHVVDFCRKLRANPAAIEVLGNGQQRKSYLDVQDCCEALLLELGHSPACVDILNLGTDEYCSVDDSLSWICEELGVKPVRHYTGGERGWVGDSPFIFLDCSQARSRGWRPELSIREAVVKTVRYLQAEPWVLDAR